MIKQSLGIALTAVIAAVASDGVSDMRSDLTVHEWGTFTTVAGQDGRAVPWRALGGPVDLPCFVERANLPGKFSFVTTVRMETPVIYFYAPRPLTVDVAVGFRQGLMTEFFPRPTSQGERRQGPLGQSSMHSVEWNGIRVLPGTVPDYPSGGEPNHYYAARAADAAPLQVGTQREGFLFYRGVGGFELPLRATINQQGIDIANDGPDPIPALMLFENRGGRVGFQASWLPGTRTTIPHPALDSGISSVRAALVGMLIAEGLYTREAEAMVETWSGSWFEEGIRLFYIVPKPLVDLTLPLDIRPLPDVLERVFVGRLEIATPRRLDDLLEAFDARDHAALTAHGRFLEPFSQRLLDGGLTADLRTRIGTELASATKAFETRAVRQCTTTAAPN